MKVKPGMKVKIISNRHGGQFKLGTIGSVMKEGFSNECFCVEYKGDWWCYNPEDVRRPIKKAVSRKPALNSDYTPCPKFRCGWKCRIGYDCKCGGSYCRIERHSVRYSA